MLIGSIMPKLYQASRGGRGAQQVAAKAAMERVVGVMGNRDLEPFIPALVSCIVRPAEVPDIVGKLSATTFVQTIEAPALAVMVPLLVRLHFASDLAGRKPAQEAGWRWHVG